MSTDLGEVIYTFGENDDTREAKIERLLKAANNVLLSQKSIGSGSFDRSGGKYMIGVDALDALRVATYPFMPERK